MELRIEHVYLSVSCGSCREFEIGKAITFPKKEIESIEVEQTRHGEYVMTINIKWPKWGKQ